MGWPFRCRQEELSDFLQGDFCLMFIPRFDLFPGALTLTSPFRSSYVLTPQEELPQYRERDCRTRLKRGDCVVLEVEGLGSFVRTNHHRSGLFQALQRNFPDVVSYVFCASDTGGYFKILQDGRIVRKIASNMWMEGMGNNPEVRGQPCAYELETSHIYKIDWKAQHMADMLPDFGRREVLALFDYYVGLSKFKTESLRRILICTLTEKEPV